MMDIPANLQGSVRELTGLSIRLPAEANGERKADLFQ